MRLIPYGAQTLCHTFDVIGLLLQYLGGSGGGVWPWRLCLRQYAQQRELNCIMKRLELKKTKGSFRVEWALERQQDLFHGLYRAVHDQCGARGQGEDAVQDDASGLRHSSWRHWNLQRLTYPRALGRFVALAGLSPDALHSRFQPVGSNAVETQLKGRAT